MSRFTLQYRDEYGNWECPGDPSACVFDSEHDADAAGDELRRSDAGYRESPMRVVDSDGTVVTKWGPWTGGWGLGDADARVHSVEQIWVDEQTRVWFDGGEFALAYSGGDITLLDSEGVPAEPRSVGLSEGEYRDLVAAAQRAMDREIA